MAKNKNKNKNKKEQVNKKSVKKNEKGFKNRVLLTAGFVMAAVFMPTSVLLIVGMLPTIVSIFIDRSKKNSSSITIGALNFTGCVPFLLQLWSQGQAFETTISIITEPMSIVIMYAAAAIGYLLDWAMTGLVAGVVYKNGVARRAAIKKRKDDLVLRWGGDVCGEQHKDKIEGADIGAGAGDKKPASQE